MPRLTARPSLYDQVDSIFLDLWPIRFLRRSSWKKPTTLQRIIMITLRFRSGIDSVGGRLNDYRSRQEWKSSTSAVVWVVLHCRRRNESGQAVMWSLLILRKISWTKEPGARWNAV